MKYSKHCTPNCFVAPFWRDLKPNTGGSIMISYGWVYWWPRTGQTRTCFVISWNAKDKYGYPQVFQVLLELAPPYLLVSKLGGIV